MNRTLIVLAVSALLLAACGPDEPAAVVDEQAEPRATATAAAEERLAATYAADSATAAACAAADTLAVDLLARRLLDSDEGVLAALHRIHDHTRESDDSHLRGLARFALAAGAQERHGAVGYHLGSVQIVCDHYRDDLS